MKKKKITILGGTGSIGRQTLEVLDLMPERFEINYITANNNIRALEEICNKYNPKGVVIADEKSYFDFKNKTTFKGEILFGSEGVNFAASSPENDLLLSALVGFAGVIPTLEAIKQGTVVALANKETLVSAGNIVMKAAKEHNVPILAVDSEHSAILQCLVGENFSSVEKIILTASGGPFRDTPLENFDEISIEEALKHPNWSMGSKITIDSATMMNKGFEVIEAHWLFDLSKEKIDVLIHPQSIIHSFVQFTDGSVKAQLGTPDMRIPISYALTYPERLKYDFPRLDLLKVARLDFQEPDLTRYPCLELAYKAMTLEGNAACVLNAANEICVDAFLNGKIKFTDIAKYIEIVLDKISHINIPYLDEIIASDSEARQLTGFLINN
ncbi:MAG: 1-deoxy-D-xylulose-5-phosphate reductoisomerase [Candidatus Kapabacteria bacterium]|nr:1-deoxy-D-xylulose-5-phosphate reductoisomerase [Ignavibacteriota bacterium]MCW5885732.1 1-deoxy-D-xylulose-5-phosphate reductoisomerase [Candidatus Kapabacteria bacterium]